MSEAQYRAWQTYGQEKRLCGFRLRVMLGP